MATRNGLAPDTRASGWHTTSAPLGVAGNTVLNGHHNIRGEVFGHLADLKSGDLIWAYAGARGAVAVELDVVHRIAAGERVAILG